MKKLTLLVIVFAFLSLTGCSKDAEVNAFTAEFEATTKEMASKIEASPNAAGVDGAQKSFDSHKASLTAKWDAIKDVVGFQVSADTKKKMEDGVKSSMTELTGTITKHALELGSDEATSNKAMKLMDNFNFMTAAKTK